jgi:copper chaperone CopZ
MTTTVYKVQGMTCGHCVGAVTSEISALDGVTEVTIDLNAGAVSDVHVTSAQPLDEAAVRAAVDEAGFALVE